MLGVRELGVAAAGAAAGVPRHAAGPPQQGQAHDLHRQPPQVAEYDKLLTLESSLAFGGFKILFF